MRILLPVGCIVVLTLGCGSQQKFVPVSGVVTLNGKPLVDADVTFRLKEDKPPSLQAPPSSVGKTNDKGEYTLKATTGQDGALVGTHVVSVFRIDPKTVDRDRRHGAGGVSPAASVPPRYYENPELTCEVPAEGKNDANFSLKSP
jgi:hypothetical protein